MKRLFLIALALLSLPACDIFGPKTGTVVIKSYPSGCSVYLDNEWTNQVTPARLEEVTEGQHTLEISDHHNAPWYGKVSVRADQVTEIFVDLVGEVTIKSEPPGAAIWYNGRFTGLYTPTVADSLTDYLNVIRLTLPGYFPYESEMWFRVLGEKREINIDLTLCPSFTPTYVKGPLGYYYPADTLWQIGLDGFEAKVLATDCQIINKNPVWSPDNRYLAFQTLAGVSILTAEGQLKAKLPFAKERWTNDFNWSSDSRYVAFGAYYDGIYVYDRKTDQLDRIYYTGEGFYSHNPVFSPNDQKVAFVHNSFGNHTLIIVEDLASKEKRYITKEFLTIYGDENLDLAWIDQRLLLFKICESGLWIVDPGKNDQTPVCVIETDIDNLAVSPDRTKYAFITKEGKIYGGLIGHWTPTYLGVVPYTHVRDISWPPGQDGIVGYADDGLYYALLSGQVFHITVW